MTRGARPDFIVIGAMKAATSTFHEQLARQEGIFMSEEKEPCFFSDDSVFARGEEWYRSLFAEAPEGSLRGESSTHYTKLPTYPDTVRRMRALVPDAKLIYILRHPIDRLVSQYVHEWTVNRIRVGIEEAIERHEELVAYSRYAWQVAPYLEAFGPDRVLPVLFDSLSSRPDAELERVCGFLGYERKPSWADDLEPQNVSAERLRETPLVDFLVNNPVVRRLRHTLAPRWLRDRAKSLWMLNERPRIRDDVRERLEALFDRELATLEDWVGIRLDCAGFREAGRTVKWSVGGQWRYRWPDEPAAAAGRAGSSETRGGGS